MAFAFRQGEDYKAEIQRIAEQQLREAQRALRRRNAVDEGIHEARKCIKRLRALTWLARRKSHRQGLKDFRNRLRQAARAVAPAREAHVAMQVFDGCREALHTEAGLAQEVLATWRTSLIAEQEVMQAAVDVQERRKTALAELAEAATIQWIPDDLTLHDLYRGLRRVYREGRVQHQNILMNRRYATSEQYHEWRKWIKTMWYFLRLMDNMDNRFVAHWTPIMDQLGEDLGREHDLSLLAGQLERLHGKKATKPARKWITQECDRLRRESLRQVRPWYEHRAGGLAGDMTGDFEQWNNPPPDSKPQPVLATKKTSRSDRATASQNNMDVPF